MATGLAKYTLMMADIETIIQAQEIIVMRRMIAAMKKFVDECPTPPRPDGPVVPYKLVQQDMKQVIELETLRAKYVSRVHVDPDIAAAVARICLENAKLAELSVHK